MAKDQSSPAGRFTLPITFVVVAFLLVWLAYDLVYREIPIQRLRSRVAEVRVGDSWSTALAIFSAHGYKARRSGGYGDRTLYSIVSSKPGSYTRRVANRLWSRFSPGNGTPLTMLRAPEVEINTSGTITRVEPFQ